MTETKTDRASGSAVTAPILLTLAAMTALAPVATDLYLPSLPAMAEDLRATPAAAQLTLTALLIGIGAGQLVFGPISDRLGRRTPLLIGTGLCAAAGAVAALAPDLGWLLGARLLQGFAGAAGLVIGRAMVRDIATGAVAARAFSLLMVVGGFAPVLAPILGGLLADPLGWRGQLWVVFGLSIIALLGAVFILRETLPVSSRGGRREAHGANSGIASPAFLGNAAAVALCFVVLMGYISASPFVFQTLLGLDDKGYGLAFGALALVMVTASAVSARLVGRIGVVPLLRTGLVLLVIGSTAVLAGALADGHIPALLVAGITLALAGTGLTFGNAGSLALGSLHRRIGLGSALLGSGQFAAGAVASPLVGLGGASTAVPLGIVMAIGAVGALLAHISSRVRGRS